MTDATPPEKPKRKREARKRSRPGRYVGPGRQAQHGGLSDRQRLFIAEYLVDLNASAAALRAGYAAAGVSVTATRLLKRPAIKAAVDAAIAARAAKAGITAERVLAELALIGFCNMQDFMSVGPGGLPTLDWSGLSREQAAALAEVVVDEYTEGRGEDAERVRRVKFKLADKRQALVDIGKHLGMFRDRVEMTGAGGGPLLVQWLEPGQGESEQG